MKQITNYKRTIGYLDKIFNLRNAEYFNSELLYHIRRSIKSSKKHIDFSQKILLRFKEGYF